MVSYFMAEVLDRKPENVQEFASSFFTQAGLRTKTAEHR